MSNLNGKKLMLTYPHREDSQQPGSPSKYKIERITNSTQFKPGQFLTEKEVSDLIGRNWEVTSTPAK